MKTLMVMGTEVRIGDRLKYCLGRSDIGARAVWGHRVVEGPGLRSMEVTLAAIIEQRGDFWFEIEREELEVNEWGEVSP